MLREQTFRRAIENGYHSQGVTMCVALIGGKDGLNSGFRDSAARAGFDLWFLDGAKVSLASRIEHLDALVILAGQVSPRVKEQVLNIAEAKGIPAYCASCEGSALCGISYLN
jgi:hypothetical protein